MTEQQYNQEIANTIFQQIGGHRFVAMTGAKNFVYEGPDLTFTIPKADKGINIITIIYQRGPDLYKMQFKKAGRKNQNYFVEVISEYEGIYFDQLTEIFEKETKIRTSL